MSEDFQLDPRLTANTVDLGRWTLSRILLLNAAAFPWLILVPKRPGLKDFHDLAASDLPVVTDEIVRASRLLQTCFEPDKINVAALGNMVAQLHIHVIARFTDDPCWPHAAFGSHDPCTPEDLAARIEVIRAGMATT